MPTTHFYILIKLRHLEETCFRRLVAGYDAAYAVDYGPEGWYSIPLIGDWNGSYVIRHTYCILYLFNSQVFCLYEDRKVEYLCMQRYFASEAFVISFAFLAELYYRTTTKSVARIHPRTTLLPCETLDAVVNNQWHSYSCSLNKGKIKRAPVLLFQPHFLQVALQHNINQSKDNRCC
jgi:hypothetical protein